MAQVKGRLRLLTTRFSSDRVGRVKYSMLCPSRIDSPCAARRAMPMSLGLSESGRRGKVDIFAFCSPIVVATGGRCQEREGRRESGGLRALDKVVNSLDYETLVLMLLLTLRRARARFARARTERSWSWAGAGVERADAELSWAGVSRNSQ